MNYKKIEQQIIENRKRNPLPADHYSEKHHIIPRSMGGTDDLDNLVDLTAREHFLVHYCLWKACPEGPEKSKLAHAFRMMGVISGDQQRYMNSKLYAAARESMSKRMSELQSGSKNSQYNTMWITNGPESKKIKVGEPIPEGWRKGRYSNGSTYDPEVPYKHERFNCIQCGTEFFRKKNKGINYRKKKCDSCISLNNLPFLRKNEKEFVELYKKTGSMNKACKALGISYGSRGNMSKIGTEILQEHGLV